MPTLEEYKIALQCLNDIKISRVDCSGICPNFNNKQRKVGAEIKHLTNFVDFTDWEEFSGSSSFPVPSYNVSYSECLVYHETYNLWSKRSKYGKARWRLLYWCIQQVEDKIKQLENENA